MKIQLNKIGLEYSEYSKEDENGKKLRFGDYDKVHLIAYYCPMCGSELYGLWKNRMLTDELYKKNYSDYDREMYNRYKQREETITNLMKEEINEFSTLQCCPVCGGLLSRAKGFAITNIYKLIYEVLPYTKRFEECKYRIKSKIIDRYSDEEINLLIEAAYHEMESDRKQSDLLTAEKTYQDISSTFNIPSNQSFSEHKIDSIKGSSNKLIEYTQNLIDIENDIYSLKKRLADLYLQRLVNNRKVLWISNYRKVRECESLKDIYIAEAEIKAHSDMIAKKRKTPVLPTNISKPIPPVFKSAKWYNRRSIEKENAQMQAEYEYKLGRYDAEKNRLTQELQNEIHKAEQKLARYEEKLNAFKKTSEMKIEEEVEQIKNNACPEKVIKVLLDTEIQNAEEALKKLFEYRNELYGMNIIYDKYRNVVALCSFCEYLKAGRCKALDGADGAYNMYEAEIRANLIIDKLDKIAVSVDNINKNQYMIYSELKEIKKSLNIVQQTMNTAVNSIQQIATNQRKSNEYLAEIAENSDYIAYNTAVDAYYSKINAHLTNSLGYLIALK